MKINNTYKINANILEMVKPVNNMSTKNRLRHSVRKSMPTTVCVVFLLFKYNKYQKNLQERYYRPNAVYI